MKTISLLTIENGIIKDEIMGIRVQLNNGELYDIATQVLNDKCKGYSYYLNYQLITGELPKDELKLVGVDYITRLEYQTKKSIPSLESLTRETQSGIDNKAYQAYCIKVRKLEISSKYTSYTLGDNFPYLYQMIDYVIEKLGIPHHTIKDSYQELLLGEGSEAERIKGYITTVVQELQSHNTPNIAILYDILNILASYAIEDIRRIGNSREDYYEDIDMMLEVGDQIGLKDIPVNLRASKVMSKSSYNHSLNYSSATGNIENLLTLLAHTYGRGKTPELQVCATREGVRFGTIGVSMMGEVHLASGVDLLSRTTPTGERTISYSRLNYLKQELKGEQEMEEVILTPRLIEELWFKEGVYDSTNPDHIELVNIARVNGLKVSGV